MEATGAAEAIEAEPGGREDATEEDNGKVEDILDVLYVGYTTPGIFIKRTEIRSHIQQ